MSSLRPATCRVAQQRFCYGGWVLVDYYITAKMHTKKCVGPLGSFEGRAASRIFEEASHKLFKKLKF